MTSPVLRVQDALAEELSQEGLFGVEYVLSTRFQPEREVSDFEQLTITIVPNGLENSRADRKRLQNDCSIDIGVQKRLPASDANTEGIRPWLDLVHQINVHLADAKRLRDIGASWAGSEYAPLFHPDHLFQKRLFTSVLRVTYRLTI